MQACQIQLKATRHGMAMYVWRFASHVCLSLLHTEAVVQLLPAVWLCVVINPDASDHFD